MCNFQRYCEFIVNCECLVDLGKVWSLRKIEKKLDTHTLGIIEAD